MPYLLKLRTLLLYNRLYISLAIVITMVALLLTLMPQHSKFIGNEATIKGCINNIKINEDKIVFEIIMEL